MSQPNSNFNAASDASVERIATSLALIQQDLRYISRRLDEMNDTNRAITDQVNKLENRMTKIEERSAIWQGAQATWSVIVGAIAALVGDMRR